MGSGGWLLAICDPHFSFSNVGISDLNVFGVFRPVKLIRMSSALGSLVTGLEGWGVREGLSAGASPSSLFTTLPKFLGSTLLGPLQGKVLSSKQAWLCLSVPQTPPVLVIPRTPDMFNVCACHSH